MIHVLLWKEYREQRAVWLTLLLVGAAALFGMAQLMAPSPTLSFHPVNESVISVAVLLVWTYGMVCGAMLLAGERESATLIFLDVLPVRRVQLWAVKGLVGLLFLLGYAVALFGFALAAGAVETALEAAGMLAAMVVMGGVGLIWGLFFSARGSNVLNTIALAIVGQIAAWIAANLLAAVLLFLWAMGMFWLFGPGVSGGDAGQFIVGFALVLMVVLTLAALAGSAGIFSRPDRQRRLPAVQAATPRRTKRLLWASWGRMFWLSYVQMRRMVLGMMFFALALGFLLPAAGPVVWPALTLLIGVLCGVTVFGDEQMQGSFRFLGDQRFPLGRVWLVKLSMRWALAVFAAFLLMLPSLILTLFQHAQEGSSQHRPPFFSEVMHSALVGTVVPSWLYLSIWLTYGFTVAHLCGLLFRKSLVAGVVSLGWGSMLVCVWIPSLVGIGLHFWQVAGVPLILLAAARLLMPVWAADRLATRSTIVKMGGVVAAVVLWTAGGMWYRVAEVPDVPDQFDMPAFVAAIPPLEKNDAGQTIRSSHVHMETLRKALWAKTINNPAVPNVPMGDPTLERQAQAVLEHGWPAGKFELGDWLDQQFADADLQKSLCSLACIADLPLGVVENPKDLTFDARLGKWQDTTTFDRLLIARGLQLQARGDRETFVDYLRTGLALSRNMQHLAPLDLVLIGRRSEIIWLIAFDRWLENLEGPADAVEESLKQVQAILLQHEEQLPKEADMAKAEYLIALNSLEMTPRKVLELQFDLQPNKGDELVQAELETASLLWRFPWEHERHLRILRVMFQGDQRERRAADEWGGRALTSFRMLERFQTRGRRFIADLHAGQIKVALRRYQARTGKLPATLKELVPDYLPAVPSDPFDGNSFRYRVSRGEEIGWPQEREEAPQGGMPGIPGAAAGEAAGEGIFGAPPPPPTRFVPAGQGILWSVGEDGHDDGGLQQQNTQATGAFGEDIIYLVPPPPE